MSVLEKRTTVYLDKNVYRLLKLKSLETALSMSELINQALLHELDEDAEDLREFELRDSESSISYESVLKEFKKSGKI